ncbi:AraC family transcriptional regulator [Amylibacter kogurei]|uniref:AraC family transcriptional regulator n=1 Tax=Paramylibacter kogurei TaxID=1889778 RepID=A0A2G5K3E4_9RHOB|nr:AraC family transcriptional regulator [Amylibacter kogurei]PIB24056.1 AraC family transcriptional regulator [Amylibacter kogurei]
MSKMQIKQFIETRADADGLIDIGLNSVQIFRATAAVPCDHAVFEPCVIAIVQGAKEAIFDGRRYIYDDQKYMCCPMSMPLRAGAPDVSPQKPLFGVYISLDQRVMTELAIEMENAGGSLPTGNNTREQGIRLAQWDDDFSDALLRILQLSDRPTDIAVLAESRLRELYYAILKGDAGIFARRAFGVGNAIARSIAHMTSNLNETVSIDDMADRAGLSRAVFHRKFKQATSMSPIQYMKSMRLNNAAMKIATGTTVSEAAMDVGYISASQFSREFKRMYGLSPRQWGDMQHDAPRIN